MPIKLRFHCKEHGFVGCGFGEPIEAIYFNQRGEVGRSCPLCFKSRPMSISRFTELVDCNKKDIYEGDIVKGTIHERIWTRNGRSVEAIGTVIIHPHMGVSVQWKEHKYNGIPNLFETEIIGNIYENGYLLT